MIFESEEYLGLYHSGLNSGLTMHTTARWAQDSKDKDFKENKI